MKADWLGHNSAEATITVEARLFNSLTRFASGRRIRRHVDLPVGSTVADLMRRLSVPERDVFLILRNGRDITRSLHTTLNTGAFLNDGDVIALSGPVPYSWGYGAPVV